MQEETGSGGRPTFRDLMNAIALSRTELLEIINQQNENRKADLKQMKEELLTAINGVSVEFRNYRETHAKEVKERDDQLKQFRSDIEERGSMALQKHITDTQILEARRSGFIDGVKLVFDFVNRYWKPILMIVAIILVALGDLDLDAFVK
jgi:hypothetical protein